MSNTHIRDARDVELESISTLTKDLFDMYREIDEQYTDFSDAEAFTGLIKQIEVSISESEYLVADSGDDVIGFLHGKIDSKTKIAYIVNIYIQEPYRGKTLGTLLFESFKEKCKKAGVTRINLMSDIRSEAYGVWIKKGFVPFAHRMFLEI